MSTNYYLTTIFDQIQGEGRFSNHIARQTASKVLDEVNYDIDAAAERKYGE